MFGKIANAFVFCAIEHDTRRVHLLGITIHPTDDWIANVLRAATLLGGPLAERKYWILDNDGKYGERTIAILGDRLIWTSEPRKRIRRSAFGVEKHGDTTLAQFIEWVNAFNVRSSSNQTPNAERSV